MADTANEEGGVVIQAAFCSTHSREVLDSYRQQLGLGPCNNLISSGVPGVPETHPKQAVSIYHHEHQHTDESVLPPPSIPKNKSSHNLHSEDTSVSVVRNQPPTAPGYLGNSSLPHNMSADVPEDENCRLWITGLPPKCTISDVLGAIRGIGRVYSLHINPPVHNEKTGKLFPTSAASLTFFTANASNRFLLLQSQHPFSVKGWRTKVGRHRIRAKPFLIYHLSRVLVIKGSPKIVTPENLTRIFIERWGVRFDTDFIDYRPGEQSSEIIWGFGSFRGQAHSVYINITDQLSGVVTVSYGQDPCA
ncbi:hypothetical protein F5Y00DRAFT_258741 [Daldinia vernicosa]|uniref:uncharacterized protein n=1 Tax=Daldinia vernicosa TaxID=114800 RepID=UPI002007444A|nr:uncharacterized protein F5Y00DRAFT_258741 [Daldinia vernicosa]KAI0852334.1 hypothetical protein F5Y00DRAFT_258741 [Daldinia vernicosa]